MVGALPSAVSGQQRCHDEHASHAEPQQDARNEGGDREADHSYGCASKEYDEHGNRRRCKEEGVVVRDPWRRRLAPCLTWSGGRFGWCWYGVATRTNLGEPQVARRVDLGHLVRRVAVCVWMQGSCDSAAGASHFAGAWVVRNAENLDQCGPLHVVIVVRSSSPVKRLHLGSSLPVARFLRDGPRIRVSGGSYG